MKGRKIWVLKLWSSLSYIPGFEKIIAICSQHIKIMRSIAVIFVTLTTAKRSFEETHEGKTCQKAYLYFLCDCAFVDTG